MICNPSEASNYKCCQMEKPCEGNKCMAWRNELVEDHTVRTFPAPPLLKPTGRGYCGIAWR